MMKFLLLASAISLSAVAPAHATFAVLQDGTLSTSQKAFNTYQLADGGRSGGDSRGGDSGRSENDGSSQNHDQSEADDDNDENDDNDGSSGNTDNPRQPGGSGCDDAGDVAEHPECKS